MQRLLTPVAVALVALAVGGCGGGESARDRVDAYIIRANTVQQGFEHDFKRANAAYTAFARSQLDADAAVRDLDGAARDIDRARAALAGLRPPPEAGPLHARLLRVFDMNADFARQTLFLARYQRGSAAALTPLDPADTRLRRDLRGARDPRRQAAAVDRFARSVGSVLAHLRSLDVPRVLAPQHRDQIAGLERTRGLARRLVRALRAQDAPLVAKLVKEFRRPSTRRGGGKRLARAALREYERRFRQLSDAYGDLRRQNAELGRTLG